MASNDVAKTVNRAMYLSWLRQNFPVLYYRAMEPVVSSAKQQGLSGFFDSLVGGFKSVVSSVGQALPGLAKTYTEYDLQKRIIKENTARANAGQAPLQYTTDGQLMAQPIAYSQMDLMLAQQLQAQSSGIDTNTLLLLGGGLVVVILFATRK